MCGIVGYVGAWNAAPVLLSGLSRLEYRGYDSAGIALVSEAGIEIHKAKGRLSVLSAQIDEGKNMTETAGIGHTRWATHGKPSDENSHPHRSASGKFAVVHNGIIENYAVIKKQLQDEGVEFLSETDTEVVAQLLDKYYTGDFFAAVRSAVAQLEGSYALGVLCADYPEELIAVRNASPLIVGLSEEGNFIASDIPAVLAHTRRILQLADHEMVRLTRDSAQVFDAHGMPVKKMETIVNWDVSSAEKGGYAHFMIKEIMEQPQALSATISPRIDADGSIVLDGVHLTKKELQQINISWKSSPASRWRRIWRRSSVTATRLSMSIRWSSSSASRGRPPIPLPPCGRRNAAAPVCCRLSTWWAAPLPARATMCCIPGRGRRFRLPPPMRISPS